MSPGGDLPTETGGHTQIGLIRGFLSWLEAGKIPVLICFNLFLATFSFIGFFTQALAINVWGHPLATPLAVGFAFLASLPIVKMGNNALGKVWPKDETSAVHEREFIGCLGTITIGTATQTLAAEVRFKGPKGDTHYAMAYASYEDLPQGSSVILVKQHPVTSSQFYIIKNPDQASDSLHYIS